VVNMSHLRRVIGVTLKFGDGSARARVLGNEARVTASRQVEGGVQASRGISCGQSPTDVRT
jgi:hypothetical protein